jgi:hypothetical protein
MANLEDSVSSVTVSSEFSGSYVKEYAYDNNTGTDWVSASEGVDSWIQFEWSSPITIREIDLRAWGGNYWGFPRFTFADASYSDGAVAIAQGNTVTYVFLHPVTTTSVRIGMTSNYPVQANQGLTEVNIRDTYTTTPTTDITRPDHLVPSSTIDYNHHKWLMFDGNTSNDWEANNDGANSWIRWEWNSDVQVSSVQLRNGTQSGASWGTPRFTYDDATYEDGGEAVSSDGFTTYNLTPKTTATLRVSVASGGSGGYRGFAEAILTGQVNPSTTHDASASLFGVGALASVSLRTAQNSASLYGAGALDSTGLRTIQASASFYGAGLAEIAAVKNSAAVIAIYGAGFGSFAASVTGGGAGTAALANTNDLDYFKLGEPFRYLAGKVDTSGLEYFHLGEPFIGIVANAGAPAPTTHNAAATVYGAGAVDVTGSLTIHSAASFNGAGIIDAISALTIQGITSIAGAGYLSSAGMLTLQSNAALVGLGLIDTGASKSITAQSEMVGVGQLGASGQRALVGASDLIGIGALVSDGQRARLGAAALTGVGAFSADGLRMIQAVCHLSGDSSLSIIARLALGGSLNLQGTGLLVLLASISIMRYGPGRRIVYEPTARAAFKASTK